MCMDNVMNTENSLGMCIAGVGDRARVSVPGRRISLRTLGKDGKPDDNLERCYSVKEEYDHSLKVVIVEDVVPFEVQVLDGGILCEMVGRWRFENSFRSVLELTKVVGVWRVGNHYTAWSGEKGKLVSKRQAKGVSGYIMSLGHVVLEVRAYMDYLLREAREKVLRQWTHRENEKLLEILLRWDRVMVGLNQKGGWVEAIERSGWVGCDVIREEYEKIPVEERM